MCHSIIFPWATNKTLKFHRKNMNKLAVTSLFTLCAISALFASVSPRVQVDENTVSVGGNAMLPQKNIVENAINSKDHTTLVAAVKAAGLVDVLEGKGPFTVFAPVNSAFAMLPDGTVDALLKPENKTTLVKILTYHVLAGRYDSKTLRSLIAKGHGKFEIKAVSGGSLSFSMNGPSNIVITDEKGGSANIPTYDVFQSNGVIHVIDRVLMPGE
jgi:uncharacterized surface protein with fasciclin (FAS1) repeats